MVQHLCGGQQQRARIGLALAGDVRRGAVDRPFYEAMTRDLRFAVYRSFGPTSILLGHIQDDVVGIIDRKPHDLVADVAHEHCREGQHDGVRGHAGIEGDAGVDSLV
jgi:hypothetical protein